MPNLIADRIAFFLKDQPPFSFLTYARLELLAERVTVKYLEANKTLFAQGAARSGFCYVVQQGMVQLVQHHDGHQDVLDECRTGDVFGVRSILTDRPYVMSAICVEECLLYAIPEAEFKAILAESQQFALFFASGYAAGQAVVRGGAQHGLRLISHGQDNQPLSFSQNVLTCHASQSIAEAAQLMKGRNVGSIIVVDGQQHPLGIVTDKDLRNKVVAEGRDTRQPIQSVMSAPVWTVASSITTDEAETMMLQRKINHLVVTESGMADSKLCGIISNHDILVSRQQHSQSLLKQLRRADSVLEWKAIRLQAEQWLAKQLAMGAATPALTGLISSLNDTIIQKAIQKALQGSPQLRPNDICWLSLGSEGREEQLLRTDQDNALILSDALPESDRKAWLTVAQHINDMLEEVGFEKCPAGMMAGNEKWCLTLTEWKALFDRWITQPTPDSVMHTTIFFDFRAIHGDTALANQLQDAIQQKITNNPIFLNHLAKNATLNPPPVGFFRQLITEKTKGITTFDIKARALMPLCDAARVLCLQGGCMDHAHTPARYRKLAETMPSSAALFEEAAEAYEVLLRCRALSWLASGDTGRMVNLDHLSKLELAMLKNALHPIGELQSMLQVRFNLAYFH